MLIQLAQQYFLQVQAKYYCARSRGVVQWESGLQPMVSSRQKRDTSTHQRFPMFVVTKSLARSLTSLLSPGGGGTPKGSLSQKNAILSTRRGPLPVAATPPRGETAGADDAAAAGPAPAQTEKPTPEDIQHARENTFSSLCMVR